MLFLGLPIDRGVWWATAHEATLHAHMHVLSDECVCVRGCGEEVLIAQLCLTLCDPMDCSHPGSSVHGILEARILE